MTSPLNSMTWKTLTPPPLPRAGTPVTAIDGTLVVSGGTYWQDGVKYFASRADRYDPATDTWTALPSLPGGLGDAPAIVFGPIPPSTSMLTRSDRPRRPIRSRSSLTLCSIEAM